MDYQGSMVIIYSRAFDNVDTIIIQKSYCIVLLLICMTPIECPLKY